MGIVTGDPLLIILFTELWPFNAEKHVLQVTNLRKYTRTVVIIRRTQKLFLTQVSLRITLYSVL